MNDVSRRRLLTGGAVVAGAGAVASLSLAAARSGGPSSGGADVATGPPAAGTATSGTAPPGTASRLVPFAGVHQAGIVTPAPAQVALLGLDLLAGVGRDDVVRMLRVLTDDARRLTQGRPALGDTEPEVAADPGHLTITLGLGPSFFTRLGLDAARPRSVRALPAFKGERLEERWGQPDLVLQVCTDDPTTLAHTTRMLTKDARTFAGVRWQQNGFRSTGAAGATPAGTPRNLLGQVDGTFQPAGDALDAAVWATGPEWFRGGTVMVLRRIAFDLETWDEFDPAGRDVVLGRRASDGSPLTGTKESDRPDLTARDAQGFTVIEPGAHVRLARAAVPSELLLRRGFNYDEGPDREGRADAGLLFIAFQADADDAFVPVQERLSKADLLNRWVTHIGSAVFAVPPGVTDDDGYLGQSLLEG